MAESSKVESSKVESKVKKALLVERESFGKSEDGEKDLYSYFINAEFRKSPIRISLNPKDNGAYNLLNIIFADSNSANARIEVSAFEMDGKTVETVEVVVYVVEDEIEYSCTLSPQRKSDKDCLKVLNSIIKAW